jgi:hypothetical protein
MRTLWRRARDLLSRDRLDTELAEELRFHQRMLERDYGPDARRRLGNVTRVREESRAVWSKADGRRRRATKF